MPSHFKTAVKKTKRQTKKIYKKTFNYKKFGDKAIDFLDNCDAPINICDGAIRSGKTITSTIAWLEFIAKHPHDEFMQSGKTRTSLYRNVLRDEMAMLEGMGIEYDHRAHDGYLQIEDKTVWLIGFAHEGISDVIRGMTIAGWNSDETNTYPKSTVEEALDRLSIDGARAFWDMNPDSPHHYIHTDYITNQEMLDAGDVKRWHFTLYDNPNLSQSYINRLERRYPKGTVGHKRKILGLWVIAEGVIYERFVEAHHTFNKVPFADYKEDGKLHKLYYDYYVLTTDYGPGNVSVIGLFGIKRTNNGNHYHLLDEFYWDVNKKNRQLDDQELAEKGLELLNFNGHILPLQSFFTPHDASSLRATLKKMEWMNKPLPVVSYTPDVLNDIETIKPLFTENRFLMSTNCINSITQAQTYSWDPKAQKIGEDKPLKIDDHCPDMWRGGIIGSRKGGNPFTESNTGYDGSNYQRRLERRRR